MPVVGGFSTENSGRKLLDAEGKRPNNPINKVYDEEDVRGCEREGSGTLGYHSREWI